MAEKIRVAVLFSGGKDSTLALYDSLQKGMDVKYLVSMISSNPESYMFHYPNMSMAKKLLDSGFEVMITSVSADGLGKEWLGKVIDKPALEKLKKVAKKHKIHLSGEGGEFETLVLNGPIFKRRLEVTSSEVQWEGDTGRFVIKDARLQGAGAASSSPAEVG
jgi:diphthamide synthase (EF-2-diphthine--ammonia ligase)